MWRMPLDERATPITATRHTTIIFTGTHNTVTTLFYLVYLVVIFVALLCVFLSMALPFNLVPMVLSTLLPYSIVTTMY